MRLRRFDLLRYGHFTDQAIDFGDGTCDNVATKQTDDFIYFSLDDWETWWQ